MTFTTKEFKSIINGEEYSIILSNKTCSDAKLHLAQIKEKYIEELVGIVKSIKNNTIENMKQVFLIEIASNDTECETRCEFKHCIKYYHLQFNHIFYSCFEKHIIKFSLCKSFVVTPDENKITKSIRKKFHTVPILLLVFGILFVIIIIIVVVLKRKAVLRCIRSNRRITSMVR